MRGLRERRKDEPNTNTQRVRERGLSCDGVVKREGPVLTCVSRLEYDGIDGAVDHDGEMDHEGTVFYDGPVFDGGAFVYKRAVDNDAMEQ